MALVPHPCFDDCAFRVDEATGKIVPRLDPAGLLSCGPDGLRASFSQTFIQNLSFFNGVSNSDLPAPVSGPVGAYRPGEGVISTLVVPEVLSNPFPGSAMISITAIVDRMIYTDPNQEDQVDATFRLDVSPDGVITSRPCQLINVYCNGAGALAIRGYGSNSFFPGFLIPQGWSGRPTFTLRSQLRGLNPSNNARGSGVHWRYTIQRYT